MEIQGKCIKILEPVRFISRRNGEEVVKTTFIIETSGQYPKKVAFTVMGFDRFNSMGVVVGGDYNVSFDVESREWNEKWFTDLAAWRAVRLDNASQPSSQTEKAAETGGVTEQKDEMPF